MVFSSETIRQSDLLNQLVLDRSTLEEIGRVEVLWMYPPAHRVLGFICKSGFLGNQKSAFQLGQIDAIGEGGVFTYASSEKTTAEKVRQIESLIGDEVWSNEGNRVGKIIDCEFQLRSGEITHYLLVSSGWANVLGEIYQLPPDRILSFGKKRVLIAESEIAQLRHDQIGLAQKLSQAGAQLEQLREEATQELTSIAQRAEETTEQAKEQLLQLTEQARLKAQRLSQQMKTRTQSWFEQAREKGHTLIEQVSEQVEDRWEQFDRNPLIDRVERHRARSERGASAVAQAEPADDWEDEWHDEFAAGSPSTSAGDTAKHPGADRPPAARPSPAKPPATAPSTDQPTDQPLTKSPISEPPISESPISESPIPVTEPPIPNRSVTMSSSVSDADLDEWFNFDDDNDDVIVPPPPIPPPASSQPTSPPPEPDVWDDEPWI
ncbi:MAG: PRC-barrel domain-containing protein [Elainella sp. Prado103]|nr:PRC-barrel domain-containing protein [Elainella sp. Prado103]